MTQIGLGVNVSVLSKTKPSKKVEEQAPPGFLPASGLQIRGQPKPLTTLGRYGENRKFVREVFERRMFKELPGRAYVEHYLLEMNRRNLKRQSLLGAMDSLKVFLMFLKSAGKIIEEVTRSDLEVFVENEQDRGLKISSVRMHLGKVYTFLHFLVEEGILHPDVLSRRIRLKLPQCLPRAINPDDLRQILSLIWDVRDRAMVLVLLRSGMRIGELLDTKISDVNIKERKITISQGVKNRRGI